MRLTSPVDPFVPEGCFESATVDQSKYAVPPVPGATVDPLSPDEPPVVEAQSAYPSPLSYSDLAHSSTSEWRLVAFPLRGAAFSSFLHPLETLRKAAQALDISGKQLFSAHQARAMADFAVAGRLSYEAIAAMGFRTPQDVVNAVMALDASLKSDLVLAVVQRAQQVAWAIRGDPGWRGALRPQLGWIGVSGEDDPPHRPCNVFSLPHPQYDIDVSVGGLTVRTRFAIAQMTDATLPAPDADPPTFLPPDEVPTLSPDYDVLFLYMPGDASSAEEAADLIPALFQEAQSRGKKAAAISFDMIGWGYSARLALDSSGNRVSFDQTLFPTVPYPGNPPALQFVEDFVVALLQTLNAGPPFIDLNRVVPIGGSLGGNLALRLGRRPGLPWLKGICGWSAASVWPSKASHPDVSPGALDGIAIGVILGLLTGYIAGAIAGGIVGAVAGALIGAWIDRTTVGQCTTQMNAPEVPSSRADHFAAVFDNDTVHVGPITLVPPQATMWYRDGWQPCKDNSMCRDRLNRREVYDQQFRKWHWRISQDQLVYSHWDADPATGMPRYELNTVPMLLAAGVKDDYKFVNIKYAAIYSNTRDLASKMKAPGTSLFLNDTGHSIHNERPMQLARSIFDFLGTYWTPNVSPARESKDLSYLVPLLLGS